MNAIVSGQNALPDDSSPVDQCARLRAALALVERMAGQAGTGEERCAAVLRAGAYARAAPITRRRFDAVVGEARIVAAAGIAALIRHREQASSDCAAAAQQLAAEMRHAIETMDRLVPPC